MVVDIRSASHIDIFYMACNRELTLEKFKVWLDDVKKEQYENGYQDRFDKEGINDSEG